jgi:hypothetical protein
MHPADLRPPTRTRALPARTGLLVQRPPMYACKPAHTPASSRTCTGASGWPERTSASAHTPGDGGERVRTKFVCGRGLHKLRRGRGRERPACANAGVSKRAGRERGGYTPRIARSSERYRRQAHHDGGQRARAVSTNAERRDVRRQRWVRARGLVACLYNRTRQPSAHCAIIPRTGQLSSGR